MFDRSPGFSLSKQQRIQNMAMDLVKFEPAEKKMNAEELKEWAARRLARAKAIEKLGNYESYECPDWKGEVPHNFMRNMREVANFDSLAMTPFLLKGLKNQAWTVIETSSSLKKRVIRFFTLRNGREIPFTFILEKVVKCHTLSDNESPGTYNLAVHKGAKFINKDKFENEVKQFFASTRHLYDFITNEIWSHIDALPPLQSKITKTSKNFRSLLQPISEIQTTSVESQKSVISFGNSKEVHNSSDLNIKRDNGIPMQNRRKEQGYPRGGVTPRGSHSSHSLNNSYSRGAHHTNSTLRSNYGVNKDNNRYNSHNCTSSTRNPTQEVRKDSSFRANRNFSPNNANKENTLWHSRKDHHKEVQKFGATQGPHSVTILTSPKSEPAIDVKKESSSSGKEINTTNKLDTPKDVNIVNKETPKEVHTKPFQNAANFHGEKIMHSRGGSFNISRNANNRKPQ